MRYNCWHFLIEPAQPQHTAVKSVNDENPTQTLVIHFHTLRATVFKPSVWVNVLLYGTVEGPRWRIVPNFSIQKCSFCDSWPFWWPRGQSCYFMLRSVVLYHGCHNSKVWVIVEVDNTVSETFSKSFFCKRRKQHTFCFVGRLWIRPSVNFHYGPLPISDKWITGFYLPIYYKWMILMHVMFLKKTLLGSCGFCVLVLYQSSYTGCLFIDMSDSWYTFPFLGTHMGLIILVVYK